jgi:hypothetical protein
MSDTNNQIQAIQEIIYFYGHDNPYGLFSNFFPATFTENFITYNSSEQYFMKKKQELFDSENHTLANKIMSTSKQSIIKSCGRKVLNYNNDIWKNLRYQIMVDALRLKFGQNIQLLNELIKTHPAILAEASPSDTIWGIGSSIKEVNPNNKNNWRGQNLLGKALMQVRSEFIEHMKINDNSPNIMT